MSKAHEELAGLVATSSISPEGRRDAVANTLREISAVLGETDFSIEDLGAAFVIVSKRRDRDTPPIAVRRATCSLLAELVKGADRGDARKVVPYLSIIIEKMGGNPRAEAIASTAQRELDEIRQFCRMAD